MQLTDRRRLLCFLEARNQVRIRLDIQLEFLSWSSYLRSVSTLEHQVRQDQVSGTKHESLAATLIQPNFNTVSLLHQLGDVDRVDTIEERELCIILRTLTLRGRRQSGVMVLEVEGHNSESRIESIPSLIEANVCKQLTDKTIVELTALNLDVQDVLV